MSSSDALVARRPAARPVEFAEWTPEVLPITVALPSSPGDLRAALAEYVEVARQEERTAADARAAERQRQESAAREKAVREAYDRGHAEGREEGERAEAARLRSAARAAEEVLDALREGEVRWTGTIEENVCALAVTIARHVIGRDLSSDISGVAELVRNALREFPIDQPIRIRVNPSDLNALASVGAVEKDPLGRIVGDREARWHPDAAIAPGGCIVEGRERIIDGRVDTALERVYRRLTYTNA